MARRQINNNNRYNNNNNNHNPNGYGVGHHHHHRQQQQQHPDSVMNQLSWFTGAPYTKFMLFVSVASYCISRSTTISSSMLLFESSFHHMSNSRNRGGDHPYMLYYSYGFYNRIAGGFNSSSSSSSSSSSLFFTRYILSKLFYSGKITSNSEFLIGICLLTYMMRKYEREMGSRRFILFYIFINVITIVMEFFIVTISSSSSSSSSSIWLLGSSIIPTYTYRGPYPLLGALFIGLFHRYTPRLYPQFLGLFGIHCSEKIFYYLGFLQLICITSNSSHSNNSNSNSHFLLRYLYNDKMIPVLCGAIACSAYLAIPTTTKRTLDDILLPDYIVNIISPWSTRLLEGTSPVYVTHGTTTTTTLNNNNNNTTTTSANSRGGGGAAGAFRQYRGGGIAPTSGATSRAAAAASRQGPPGRLGGGNGGLGDMASALQQQEQLLQQLLSQTPYHAPSNMMAPGGATTAGSQQQQQQQQQAPALRPSAPTPVVEPDPAAMEQLTMMGFEQTQVIAALRRTNNNVERAADQLLQQAGMG